MLNRNFSVLYLLFKICFFIKKSRGSSSVGAESAQQVNIYSFAVRCDRMWPSTQ